MMLPKNIESNIRTENDKQTCDLCKSRNLKILYVVSDSALGMRVAVCKNCGLVLSLPSKDKVEERKVSISSGAGWGNIRYGKGFRTKPAIKIISSFKDIRNIRRCLDIGSNRGDFLLRLMELSSQVDAVGVEPDERVISLYKDNPNITLINRRFEDAEIGGTFDLIYCCHTLEHVSSPSIFLEKSRKLLAEDGLMYIEVPNLDTIKEADVVEEFFIDKHTYHFSDKTLHKYLQKFGLADIYYKVEQTNLICLVKKNGLMFDINYTDQKEAERIEIIIDDYRNSFSSNIYALRQVGDFINNNLKQKRIVFWGAGRIFDSLMKYGNINRQIIVGVIDKYLSDYMNNVHGFTLKKPTDLHGLKAEVIVILSREYADEILREIKQYHIENVKVLTFSELIRKFR